MADKNLMQKHDKAITTMEGKLEHLQGVCEQLQIALGDNQAQTNCKIEALGVQVNQLTKAAEDLKLGVTELMKALPKTAHVEPEGEGSTLIQGKTQTPTHLAI